MTYFIRDNDDNNLFEIEVGEDIHASVNLISFASHMIETNERVRGMFAIDCDTINEIRGSWYEGPDGVFFNKNQNINDFVKRKMNHFVKNWPEFIIIED